MANKPDGVPGWGWSSCLLHYIEQHNLELSIQRNLPIAHTANQQGRETVIPTLLCGSDWHPKVPTIYGGAPEGDEDEAFAANVDAGTALFRIARTNYVGVFGVSEIEDSPAAQHIVQND